ncbi:alpha/beta hydrolase [Bradyrhizobium hipponense]|uniref:Alpha/beta hydrolase n=1 Tax=Bradyrhizobium hipponense TaxID=2605638 RepID=A0A5S4YIU9_9BRAD|nr:alpha/beta hydrolase [Bradyrhizobium hipponense]TYO64336.1 alpha/beta hydrolase [Bradyrhizobium hipponense]
MHLRSAALMLLVYGGVTTVVMAEEPKRISIDGYEIAYVETGKGDPVIFVHGGLQDYRMWSEQLPKFGAQYRAIAYSRRNNYPNKRSPEGMPDGAADVHGEDLAALVRALGYSKARIVAHSSGAHAALFFAATHPDMVVSLALNEPPATGMLNGVPDELGKCCIISGGRDHEATTGGFHLRDGQKDYGTYAVVQRRTKPALLSSHCRSVGNVFAQPRKDRDCGKLAYRFLGKPRRLRSGGAFLHGEALTRYA